MNSNSTDSGFLDTCSVSSPNIQNGTPLLGYCRKRKASCIDKCTRNISDVMDCYSPPFSSTLNESLTNHLEKFHLDNERGEKVSTTKSVSCIKKGMEHRKFCSVPNTPEHQVKYSRESITKKANTNSVVKNFSQLGMMSQSPLNKEVYEILYPELPSLEPIKKPATPVKLDKSGTQAKKRLFSVPRLNPLKQVLSNRVIMNIILKQLSNGDLFRLATVSGGFKDAILNDFEACSRFSDYKQFNKLHKENYRITPPSSPEKDDMEVEASPGSKNFSYFHEFARGLNKNQSLTKCPRCQKASIVENDIGQCQEINKCGYIFCKKCNSFANNPKDFKDKCNGAQLLNTTKFRNHFGDLSNSTITSDYTTDSSFFSTSLINSSYKDSGIFSDCEISTPKQSVKRNLTKSFMVPSEVKIFSSNARILTPQIRKQPRRASLVPVIPLEASKTPPCELMEPSSPPKVKQHSACSKQSKRNLKRLTR